MIGRRQILQLFTGGAASAVAGVSPTEAARHLSGGLGATAGNQSFREPGPLSDGVHEVAQAIHRRRQAQCRPMAQMPVHIRTKKSWSPAFKVMEAEREEELLNEFERRLFCDDEFAKAVVRALGLAE